MVHCQPAGGCPAVFIALLAGFIDSIAGGGGLLTLPSLLAAGLSPAQALATNKLQSVGGSFSASLYFVRRGAITLREQRLNIAMTFLGAVGGAVLIQHLQADFLRQILPLLLIAIGMWFLLMPRIGEEDRVHRLRGCLLPLSAAAVSVFMMVFLARELARFMRWAL